MNIFEYAKFKKMFGNSSGGESTGGSGGGIIDVTELPTNYTNGAVYRLTTQNIELYIVGMEENPVPYLQMMREQMGGTINVEIVETLPDTLTSVDEENMIITIYVVKSTGIAYCDMGDGAMTFGQAAFGLEGFDRGWSSDINAETEMGIYTCEVGCKITLHIYANGEWGVYVDDDELITLEEENTALQENVQTLETQVSTLEDENTSLTKQVATLENENATLNSQVDDLTPASDFINYASLESDSGIVLTTFTNNTATYVIIPEYVTSIGEEAFKSRQNLKSVEFLGESKLTSIGVSAFEYCTSLISIDIPQGVTSIGTFAFQNCQALESVQIPNSIATIGTSAFRYCYALKSITIPNGMTTIPSRMCTSCSELTDVSLPVTVTEFETYAFSSCAKLTSITYAGTKEQWKAITKGTNWDSNTPDYTITCTDGTIAKDGTET